MIMISEHSRRARKPNRAQTKIMADILAILERHRPHTVTDHILILRSGTSFERWHTYKERLIAAGLVEPEHTTGLLGITAKGRRFITAAVEVDGLLQPDQVVFEHRRERPMALTVS